MMKSILTLFTILIFLHSCGFRCIRSWTFEVPFHLENEKASYKVKDTIWISSYLDQKLTDAITGEQMEYPDFTRHQMGLIIVELDGVNAIYAQEKMELFPVQGEYSFITFAGDIIQGDEGAYTVDFEHNPPHYEAKFGIIMNEPGKYLIQVGSIAWTINDMPVEISECKDYLGGFEVKFSNESDFNFDIYEPLAKPHIFPAEKEEYINSGFFTFIVEE